jgi:hypothetical protein
VDARSARVAGPVDAAPDAVAQPGVEASHARRSLAAVPIRSRMHSRLALRPTIPARERFYADTRASATRQRTLEANGIDCGAGPVSGAQPLTPRGERRALATVSQRERSRAARRAPRWAWYGCRRQGASAPTRRAQTPVLIPDAPLLILRTATETLLGGPPERGPRRPAMSPAESSATGGAPPSRLAGMRHAG